MYTDKNSVYQVKIDGVKIDGFEKGRNLCEYKKVDHIKSQLYMAKKKVHQSYKIGKASQIPKNEAYFSYSAVMRDAAQPKAKIEIGLFTKP